MKTIIHVRDDENNVEGMFTEDGELLGSWSLDDAHWRSEYFDSFMNQLGFEIIEPDEHEEEELVAVLRELYAS